MTGYLSALASLAAVGGALVYGEALALQWILGGLVEAPLWAWAVAVVVLDLSTFLVVWGLRKWR
jgi:hypothetical protein